MKNKTQTKYSEQRFNNLSDKLLQLQQINIRNPMLILNLEEKIDFFHIEAEKSLRDLEFKIISLEDELVFIMINIEDKICSRKNLKEKFFSEIKETEIKLNLLIQEEKKKTIELNLKIIKKFHAELKNLKDNHELKIEKILSEFFNLKEIIGNDILNFKNNIDINKQEKDYKNKIFSEQIEHRFLNLNGLVFFV